jgi:hypothetical protein
MKAGAAASTTTRAFAPQQRVVAEPPTVQQQEQHNKYAILVHPRQTGNDVLKYIRNVPYRFEPGAANCCADYVIGSTVVIFVTIKWHLTHASYTEKVRAIRVCVSDYTGGSKPHPPTPTPHSDYFPSGSLV